MDSVGFIILFDFHVSLRISYGLFKDFLCFSPGTPMVLSRDSLWFSPGISYGFFRDFLLFPQGFPMVSIDSIPDVSNGFPMVSQGFSTVSEVFPRISCGFPMVSNEFPNGCPMDIQWFLVGRLVSRISMDLKINSWLPRSHQCVTRSFLATFGPEPGEPQTKAPKHRIRARPKDLHPMARSAF